MKQTEDAPMQTKVEAVDPISRPTTMADPSTTAYHHDECPDDPPPPYEAAQFAASQPPDPWMYGPASNAQAGQDNTPLQSNFVGNFMLGFCRVLFFLAAFVVIIVWAFNVFRDVIPH